MITITIASSYWAFYEADGATVELARQAGDRRAYRRSARPPRQLTSRPPHQLRHMPSTSSAIGSPRAAFLAACAPASYRA